MNYEWRRRHDNLWQKKSLDISYIVDSLNGLKDDANWYTVNTFYQYAVIYPQYKMYERAQ